SSGLEPHEIIDKSASFPTDGRLIGKLVNPNIQRRETAGSPERWFRIVGNTATTIRTDPADGDLRAYGRIGDPYHVTGVFALERIDQRWWLIDPEGNAFFPRAVSITDTRELYSRSHPSLQAYAAIFLESRGGERTKNLSDAAENPHPGDVVARSGVSLRDEGD